MTDQTSRSAPESREYQTLRSRLLCWLGLHAWKCYGPFKVAGESRAMWARCECGKSRYLCPGGANEGRKPRLFLGRGVYRDCT